MPQPIDSAPIVAAAADAIVAGTIDDSALYAAAGHSVKLGDEQNEYRFLRVVVLLKAGKYSEAVALIMEIALDGGTTTATAVDPLAHVLGSVTVPTTTTKPVRRRK